MSRFSWSRGGSLSPYSSMSGGVPNVTDEDYSYITSQDIDAPTTDSYYDQRPPSPQPVSDDVLLIKNRGVTYPAHFPKRSLADGKVLVQDVAERIVLMMGLPNRVTSSIKLLYKGKKMSDPGAPVWRYGVKNKSEIMAIVPDGALDNSGSPSTEEVVDVAPGLTKSQRRRKNKKKDKPTASDGTASSSNASSSNAGAPTDSGSKGMQQLEEISSCFFDEWKPLCEAFIARPPSDPKKIDEEHLRLSESVMQHVILKTDNVETDGNPDVRAQRKALIKETQIICSRLDEAAKAAKAARAAAR
ncbi:BAG domain [Geosmithia morbida]|uniref:BAG domain n=1 Tax=Geosmithia morbida TaxID=1094350 RepID=A0A9P4YRT3_9HYPO|nr:BAG domain [Geosmithia morbida]KAF4121941.1 BAG domain [Geosmithia morbida]